MTEERGRGGEGERERGGGKREVVLPQWHCGQQMHRILEES